MQDCKDGSGLQLIKLDFVTDGQEIKLTILVEFDFFRRHFLSSVKISLLSSHLAIFFPYFKIIQ